MTKKKQETTHNSEKILLGVLIVLIVFSGVQAYQVNEIRQDIQDGEIRTATTSSDSETITGTPKSLQDLPQMVGGC